MQWFHTTFAIVGLAAQLALALGSMDDEHRSNNDDLLNGLNADAFKKLLRGSEALTLRPYDGTSTKAGQYSHPHNNIWKQRWITSIYAGLRADYYNYTVISRAIHVLEQLGVDGFKVMTIGRTHENRPIKLIKLGLPKYDSNGRQIEKPAIFLEAGAHAREWLPPTASLYIMTELLQRNENLLEEIDWYVLPVMNPDGYQYSHTKNSDWRKNRAPNNGDECKGVDLNRNTDFFWGTTMTSNYTCAFNYGGKFPFSEPETRAVRDFVLKHRRQIKVYLSMHSFGAMLFVPYGDRENHLHQNFKELSQAKDRFPTNLVHRRSAGETVNPKFIPQFYCPTARTYAATVPRGIAQDAADAMEPVLNTKYDVGTAPELLYGSSGATEDWAAAKAGIPMAFGMEMGRGGEELNLKKSQQPDRIMIPKIGEEVWRGVKVIAFHMLDKHERGKL